VGDVLRAEARDLAAVQAGRGGAVAGQAVRRTLTAYADDQERLAADRRVLRGRGAGDRRRRRHPGREVVVREELVVRVVQPEAHPAERLARAQVVDNVLDTVDADRVVLALDRAALLVLRAHRGVDADQLLLPG